MHFPEELTIKSIGSGYGGNALLGKKCHALRIASCQARSEGWLAEHMLIVGMQDPRGEIHYIAAAFPSACGKTNLAMLIPPESYREAGWKVWTVGDDICWMTPGADGRLWAINPEAGYFGVAPGTSEKTNANALGMLNHDAIFTNVALTADGDPWWEGLPGMPAKDWQGRDVIVRMARSQRTGRASEFALHGRRRGSARAGRRMPRMRRACRSRRSCSVAAASTSCRSCSRRATGLHGVLVGAAMGSETTAAATGAVGVLRRDSMAMKPFCGYNFADYFGHWLSFDKPGAKLPKIFHVNWFRKERRRQVPVARLRRQHARARMDHRPLHRQRGRGGNADRQPAACGRPQSRPARAVACSLDALLDVDIEGWIAEYRKYRRISGIVRRADAGGLCGSMRAFAVLARGRGDRVAADRDAMTAIFRLASFGPALQVRAANELFLS